MALPIDVRELMKSSTRFVEERSQPVRLAILVEVDAPDALIDAVREQFRPITSAASLQVEVTELGQTIALAPGTDVVIALAGTGNVGLRQALAGPRGQRIPVAVVALGEEIRVGQLADALSHPTGDLIVRSEPHFAVARLGSWLADNLGSKRLALAHNFAFMRSAVAMDAVKTTAWQNGLLGAVTPIPGTDMPIMTANQIKMLLQIAAAYGQPLGVERIRELAAVVAGGYLLRAVARQALLAFPVFGWAFKGGIGYTGTIAMGKAAVRYFEEGADLSQVTAYFRGVRDKAARGLPRRAARRLPPPQPQLPSSPVPAEASAEYTLSASSSDAVASGVPGDLASSTVDQPELPLSAGETDGV
jgi:uncharacterized protein (DUF697 family)